MLLERSTYNHGSKLSMINTIIWLVQNSRLFTVKKQITRKTFKALLNYETNIPTFGPEKLAVTVPPWIDKDRKVRPLGRNFFLEEKDRLMTAVTWRVSKFPVLKKTGSWEILIVSQGGFSVGSRKISKNSRMEPHPITSTNDKSGFSRQFQRENQISVGFELLLSYRCTFSLLFNSRIGFQYAFFFEEWCRPEI